MDRRTFGAVCGALLLPGVNQPVDPWHGLVGVWKPEVKMPNKSYEELEVFIRERFEARFEWHWVRGTYSGDQQ